VGDGVGAGVGGFADKEKNKLITNHKMAFVHSPIIKFIMVLLGEQLQFDGFDVQSK
jgi:hypothetical protein